MTFPSHRTQTSTNVSAVSKSDIVVVIPALNEAEAIGSVINELKGLGYDDILVVDGYSCDGTSEVAKRNGARVVQQHGVGKTGALRTAIDYVDRPWILVMDGDFTYDPSSIELMLTHGKKYDEVIGARKGGVRHIPLVNRFGNWVIGWVFRLLFGSGLTDVCSGMYLLRTDVAKDLDLTTRGFDLEVEVASQVAAKGEDNRGADKLQAANWQEEALFRRWLNDRNNRAQARERIQPGTALFWYCGACSFARGSDIGVGCVQVAG